MAAWVLSIDLGSTQFKAGLFRVEANGQPIPAATAAHGLVYTRGVGGSMELPCDTVATALRVIIARVIEQAGIAPGQIGSIAITSQAQTFTIATADGQPKRPFISWQDVRAQDACEAMRAESDFADFAEHASFCSLIPNLQVCQIRHLRAAEPSLLGPGDRLLPLPTYLLHLLTGEFWLDENLAAMSGHYSLKLGGWWPAALASSGLTESQLPRVCPIGAMAARTTQQAKCFGLAEGIPVILAGNDQTAGAYGTQVHRRHALLLTLGTALVAYTCVNEPPAPGPALIRGPYPGGRYYVMEADGGGGGLIGWACGVLAQCPDYDAFFQLAAQDPAGSRGLLFSPDLAGAQGRWENISSAHQPGHFARALLDGLVRRHVAMVRDLPIDLRQMTVLVAGGGSQRPLWMQLLSEALGAELEPVSGDPLLGAACLASALGEYSLVCATPVHNPLSHC